MRWWEQKLAWIYDSAHHNSSYQWALQGALAVLAAATKLHSLTNCFVSWLHAIWRAATLHCPIPLSGNVPHSCRTHLEVLMLLNCSFWELVLVLREKTLTFTIKKILLSLKKKKKKPIPKIPIKKFLQKTTEEGRGLTHIPDIFVSVDVEWGCGHMHMLQWRYEPRTASASEEGSLWIKPSSYFLSLSTPIESALIFPCPPMSWPAWQVGYFCADRVSYYCCRMWVVWDAMRWAGTAALLGWWHSCSMGLIPQGPSQVQGRSWAEFVAT